MAEIGYALSSEEHSPRALVANARAAEEAGFSFALISDHFHPWTDAQGESGFVWSMIGAIAQATERLRLGTGVTCPTIADSPGDRRPRGVHLRRVDARTLLSRARHR